MEVNDNIITEKQYHIIRGIIRGELAHFTCHDCKRHTPENYPCECAMMYADMRFKPREEYITRIAKKICNTIGEPLYDEFIGDD